MNPTDPLAALRDIHLPNAPHWWPPAPGWWLLAILLALAVVLVLRVYLRARAANASRRAALAALRSLRLRHNRSEADIPQAKGLVVSELSRLLKRYALTRYPPAEVAALSGREWLAFLARGRGTQGFAGHDALALAEAAYAPAVDADVAALLDLCERWIKMNPRSRIWTRAKARAKTRATSSHKQSRPPSALARGEI